MDRKEYRCVLSFFVAVAVPCSCVLGAAVGAVAVGKAPEPAVGGQVGPDPEGMVGDPARDFG